MRITVATKPGRKRESIRQIDASRYEISVTAQPEHGKANEAVRQMLSDHFHIAKSRISLLMGASSRVKVFELR